MSALSELGRRIEIIERGYEYLLAYAAQGRLDDRGSEARATLESMQEALDGLGALAVEAVAGVSEAGSFLRAVSADVDAARGAISLVLSRRAIGSLLIDNFNASVHVRALLTDLFLLDQALKSEASLSSVE